jgi:DNA-binding transcriptional LysR family regulator
VAELEAHLNTRLLHRTTRQLSLSEAGISYVAACRRILEEVGEAERIATGEYASPKGELVVTAPEVFGRLHVVPVVAEFLAHYPEIDISLVLTDRVVHLMDEHADVGHPHRPAARQRADGGRRGHGAAGWSAPVRPTWQRTACRRRHATWRRTHCISST